MEKRITGRTGMFCLIGTPVGHSGSPAMYNYSFAQTGLDYAYLAYDVPLEKTEEAVNALKVLGCVCEVIAHGRHNKAVCHCHGTNLNGLEHSFKFHVFSSVSYSLFVFPLCFISVFLLFIVIPQRCRC